MLRSSLLKRLRALEARGHAAPRYGIAVAAVLATTLARLLLHPLLGHRSAFLIFPLAVMVAAVYGGLGPGLLATALGAIASLTVLLWLPVEDPPATFVADQTSLAIFLFSGAAISLLAGDRARRIAAAEEALRASQRAEQRLEEALALLEPVLEGAPAALAFLNRDLRFERVNPAVSLITGRPPPEHEGRSVEELCGPELWAEVAPLLRRALAGERITGVELSLHVPCSLPAGSSHPRTTGTFLASFYPVRVRGNIVGVATLLHDITRQRQAQFEVEESERRLGLALRAARLGTWEWDLDTDILAWCERVAEMHGHPTRPTRLSLEHALQGIHTEDRASVLAALAQCRAGTPPPVWEYRCGFPDGTLRRLQERAVVVPGADGRPARVIGVTTDVTEQRRAEEELARVLDALRRSEERYQALSELTSDFAYAFRFSEDGVPELEWVSEGLTQVTGLTAEELAGRGLGIFAEEDAHHAAALLAAVREGRDHVCEARVPDRHGGRRVVRAYARPRWNADRTAVAGFLGAVQDITEARRLLEERERVVAALRESEARFRCFFDADVVGLAFSDPDGAILDANERFLAMIGASRGQFARYGLHWRQLAAQPSALPLAADGEATTQREVLLRRQDGSTFPALLGTARLLDRSELITVVLDLSAQKEAEAQLSAANARLNAALARERRIAVELQRSVAQLPLADAFPGLELGSYYEPAWEEADVGGDFMDAFSLDEERVALVVGDLSGKGLAAAAHTAEVKYAFRGLLRERGDPGAALAALNEYLCQSRGAESEAQLEAEFVCLAAAILTPASGTLTVAAGGAVPPLIARTTGSLTEMPPSGVPLGILADQHYRTVQEHLDPGDLLVMVTDGVIEARSDGELFGQAGLARTVAERREEERVEELARALGAAARTFARGALQVDICVLVVRRT